MDKKKYLSDYEAFTENEISDISAQGIALKSGMYIDFNECTKVWAEVNSLEKTTCVGGTLLSDKVFITDTTTGDVDVPKTTTGGKCEITTTTGDIEIDIE